VLEGAVFEYCEQVFNELHEKDGGYCPSKHDNVTFERAAKQFDISIAEVDRIYNDYSKLAADIEAKKIAKLPKAVQNKVRMRRMQDILLNNKDLPFHIKEGEPSEQLPQAQNVISDEYFDMAIAIAKNGWTIPLSIDIKNFNELKECINDSEKIDAFFKNFYKQGILNATCRKIKQTFSNAGQQQRFDECVSIYKQGMYSTCLTTLVSVLEGYISSFGDDPKDVRVMRICQFHSGEEQKNNRIIKSLCWLSMYEYTHILFDKQHFDQSEPAEQNRHWILHGRTSKIGEKNDCLRLFNALSTLACIKSSEHNQI